MLGRDEKIGKKDQEDCRGSEVERKALWDEMGLGRHQKAIILWWFGEENIGAPLRRYHRLNEGLGRYPKKRTQIDIKTEGH